MTYASKEPLIHRILVGVDASPQSLIALRIAGDLASKLDAELIGIFVEDVNLLRMAALPFAREIGLFSASLRLLDSPHIERQLRAQARWAHRIMANMAEQANLRWSFRTARGAIPAQLLAAASEADLVVLGRSGWSGRRYTGSTVRTVVLQAPRSTLILGQRIRAGLPVVVLYDGSPSSVKALEATTLVATYDSNIIVLVIAEDPEKARDLRQESHSMFVEYGMDPQYRWVSIVGPDTLISLVKSESCGVLILPAESVHIPMRAVIELLDQTECAVLIVH